MKDIITSEQITEEIKKGNFKIETTSACDCVIDEIGERYGVEISCNECWHQRALIVNGAEIAIYVQHNNGIEEGSNCPDNFDPCDLYDIEEIETKLIIGDNEENPSHNPQKMLEDYLTGLAEKGYKFFRDDLRGFANEYKIYIVAPSALGNDYDRDRSVAELLEDLDEVTAESASIDITMYAHHNNSYNFYEVII